MNRWWVLAIAWMLRPDFCIAESQPFDTFYLIGPSNFAASQYYQVEQRNCEVAGMLSHGNIEYQRVELTIEVRAQGAAVQCLQSLDSRSVVIGATMSSQQFTADGVIVRRESYSTTASPSLTFNITPNFSLGLEINFDNNEVKTIDERYTSSSHVSAFSASLHQDTWEITVEHSDRFRVNEKHPDLDIPRELTMNLRARPNPYVTLGLRMNRVDYPGIASGDDEGLQIESNTSLIASTRFLDMFTAELQYTLISSENGDPDGKGHSLNALLGMTFNQSMKVAAEISQHSSSNESYDNRSTTYILDFGYAPRP